MSIAIKNFIIFVGGLKYLSSCIYIPKLCKINGTDILQMCMCRYKVFYLRGETHKGPK